MVHDEVIMRVGDTARSSRGVRFGEERWQLAKSSSEAE